MSSSAAKPLRTISRRRLISIRLAWARMDFRTQSHRDGNTKKHYRRCVKQIAYGGVGTVVIATRRFPTWDARFRTPWPNNAYSFSGFQLDQGRTSNLWYASATFFLLDDVQYHYPFYANLDGSSAHEAILNLLTVNFPRLHVVGTGEWWNYVYRSGSFAKIPDPLFPGWLDAH